MAKTVQIKVNNGKWEDILPQCVRRNDAFRVLDEYGDIIYFPDGCEFHLAGEDAFVARNGSVMISYVGMITF
jgi:hypothetical protein